MVDGICMGGCMCRTFTVNTEQQARLRCIEPFVFSVSDAESVLMESGVGDYLLYRDHVTDKILLSVRYNSHIRHHRISEQNGLFYLNGQPYPYLQSIVLYHQKHRLDAVKLQKQAHLSARVVRLFAHKITVTNGNTVHSLNHGTDTPAWHRMNHYTPDTSSNGNAILHTPHQQHTNGTITQHTSLKTTTSIRAIEKTTTNYDISNKESNKTQRTAAAADDNFLRIAGNLNRSKLRKTFHGNFKRLSDENNAPPIVIGVNGSAQSLRGNSSKQASTPNRILASGPNYSPSRWSENQTNSTTIINISSGQSEANDSTVSSQASLLTEPYAANSRIIQIERL